MLLPGVLSIYESKSQWVKESMSPWVNKSMSERVSSVTQTHKMKAKISECLGQIIETKA